MSFLVLQTVFLFRLSTLVFSPCLESVSWSRTREAVAVGQMALYLTPDRLCVPRCSWLLSDSDKSKSHLSHQPTTPMLDRWQKKCVLTSCVFACQAQCCVLWPDISTAASSVQRTLFQKFFIFVSAFGVVRLCIYLMFSGLSANPKSKQFLQ